MRSFQKHLLIGGCLFSFSILLVLPQYFSGGIILGPDFLFHYNRFYDTAMQIKTGNFQYFISTYGFQQSGRIVNALYGPIFAYLQGLLLLLSKTWYNYQIFFAPSPKYHCKFLYVFLTAHRPYQNSRSGSHSLLLFNNFFHPGLDVSPRLHKLGSRNHSTCANSSLQIRHKPWDK